jgi:imidazolonepropionase-like amidohydrolase
MKKFLKYTLYVLGVFIFIGFVAFFTWIYNPHMHVLTLNPTEVYAQDKGIGYLVTNANVIDVEMGVVHANRHLLVRNGVFERIFEGPIPDSLIGNYTVIEAENRYLMPGMIDMHAHLNSGGLIPPDASTRTLALEQFARYGVGSIFTLGGHGFNQDVTSELIVNQQSKSVVGPNIFATGDILTTPGGYPISLLPMMLGVPADEIDLNEKGILTVTEETDLDALFSRKKELGMKGIKIMVESGLGGGAEEPRLSIEIVRSITQKASEYGFPVFAHVSRQSDFEDAIHAGVDVLVHTVGDQVLTNADSLFAKMRENSIYYTPTLSIAYMHQYVASAEILDDPFLIQYSSERTNRSLKNWPIRQLMVKGAGIDTAKLQQNMLQNFSLFQEAGVPILMGSDAGNPSVIPGYSAHKELEFMAQGGMPNADVLRAATIVPARFLRLDDSIGGIAEGKVASFLMLDHNPLEDIRNSRSIHRVMLEGYWIE